MAVVELPLIYLAEAASRRRRRERWWVHETERFSVDAANDFTAELVCELPIPKLDYTLQWRQIDGMIMRPLLYEYQPHRLGDDLDLESLGPDDHPETSPFFDHPSFAHSLTRTWPDPVHDRPLSLDAVADRTDFKRWRSDEREARKGDLERRLRRYRVIGDSLWKEASLPTWVVRVGRRQQSIALSPVDSTCEQRVSGFHFDLQHRTAALAFARWVSGDKYLSVEANAPQIGAHPLADRSDDATGFSVAKVLAAHMAGRAAWRISPHLSNVLATFRLAYQGHAQHSLASTLAMFEMSEAIDLPDWPLRQLFTRLEKRRKLISQYRSSSDLELLASM